MKKFKHFAFAWLMLPLAALSFAACSSDDDDQDGGTPGSTDTELPAPDQTADAAKYLITDAGTGIDAIELTEAGNYIVTGTNPAGASAMAAQKAGKVFQNPKVRMFHKAVSRTLGAQTRSYQLYSGIAYGTYTKTDENTYVLDGFGTIRLTTDASGSTYSMELTRLNGVTETLHAEKQAAATESRMTRNLCRTWGLTQVREYGKWNGRTVFDLTAPSLRELAVKMKEWAKAHEDEYGEYDEQEYNEMIEEYSLIDPEEVIFSRLGTYMVKYTSGQLAVAKWFWANETAGSLYYDWSGSEEPDADAAGMVTTTFGENTLYITETETESEEGETMEIGMVYTLQAL